MHSRMARKDIELTTFEAFGLSPALLKAVAAKGYETPSPIQAAAIPVILTGADLIGLAQTGTGKTAAFGLPLLNRLMNIGEKPQSRTARALILAPTRELVNQIADNLKGFARQTHLKVVCVVGGASINVQQKALLSGTDILVATPGRLLDLVERKAVRLDTVTYLVLDEADQMLDLGFIHALKRIAKLVGKERQTLLFSATMPKQIEELSRAYLTNPQRVEVSPPGKAADKVRQTVHQVEQKQKYDLLRACLAERRDDLSLVFSRTKHGAEKIMKMLVKDGFSAASIHGNKSQNQRERAIKAFRDGEVRILVATDVAARGIDIPGVSHVYNYDLPEVPEAYVHRIGRTARAGAGGEAVAFCSSAERHLLKAIEKLTGLPIAAASLPARYVAQVREADTDFVALTDAPPRPAPKRHGASKGPRNGPGKDGGRLQQARPNGNKRRRPRRRTQAAA